MIAAIYSRKSISTGKGESIENQIDSCKNYIKSFYPSVTEFKIYEDEGFSGGNTNRPKFQQLLKDAKNKEFNILICYRLDRISRSVADFATTYSLLEENSITFISINEQFDTNTPMGRAMMNISATFAQLERETIAERVRDNMLYLAKTGRWLGGQEPYGYKAEKSVYLDQNFEEKTLMKLTPIEEELRIVKLIFDKYLEYNSITQVANFLIDCGIKGKNGGEWASGQVARLLYNPLYVKSDINTHKYLNEQGMNVCGEPNGSGYLTYNKTKKQRTARDISEWIVSVSKHEGIIDSDVWLTIQAILDKNKSKKVKRLGTSNNNSLLSGILKCSLCGANMMIKQGKVSVKEGKRIDFYVCSKKENSRTKACNNKNVRVDRLDKIVIDQLKTYNKKSLIDALESTLKSSNDDDTNIKHESLISQIEENDKKISNLVKQLSLASNDSVSEILMKEINSLSIENSTLKENLNNNNSKIEKTRMEISNINIILDMLKKFDTSFDTITDIKQKRLMLSTIIDNVLWDGLNSKAKIVIFDDKKK